jgi:hypothetical protein
MLVGRGYVVVLLRVRGIRWPDVDGEINLQVNSLRVVWHIIAFEHTPLITGCSWCAVLPVQFVAAGPGVQGRYLVRTIEVTWLGSWSLMLVLVTGIARATTFGWDIVC